MIAAALLIIPLVCMFAILVAPAQSSNRIALGGAVLGLIASIVAYVQFSGNNLINLSENIAWIPSLGIQFNIGQCRTYLRSTLW